LRCTAGANRYVATRLDDAIERAAIDAEVAQDGERGRAPRLDPELVAIAEVAHVELADGRAREGAVRLAIDHEAARTADALAAVVVEGDRFPALADELLVHDVEHLEEGHVLGHVLRDVLLEAAGIVRSALTPHVQF